MEKESIPFTLFNAPQGMYEWVVMLFGMKNALSAFQSNMDNAFKALKIFA